MQSQSFELDYSLPLSERMGYILQSMQNPYCFTVGDITVNLSFSENAADLQSRMSRWLCRKAGG